MLPTRMRRPSTFSYTGLYRYSLTFCTFNRQPLFTDATVVDLVRSQILRAAEISGFEVLAYCFMPDHLHLLVGGALAPSNLPRFAQRAKQLSGFYGRRHSGGPLWQSGYFERVLRERDDTRSAIAYILANPVRAGLAVRPEDYPFNGSGICSLEGLMEYVGEHTPRA